MEVPGLRPKNMGFRLLQKGITSIGSITGTWCRAANKNPGRNLSRFFKVDERLTVWVNDTLPFGDGVEYPTPKQKGPTLYDLEPASIGSKHATFLVRHIRLWRDNYYTPDPTRPETQLRDSDWADSQK